MKPTVWVKQYEEAELSPVPGIAGRWKRYIDGDDTGERLISGLGRLEPGEDMGWHSHPEEEVFFIVSGRGTVRWEVDNRVHEAEVEPGCAFYKVGDVPHQMLNTGTEPLVGIFAKVSVNEGP
jgi:mannose-6-phosphate isomerase-like protein (cupin superfamily)